MNFNNAGYVQTDGPFPSSRRMDPLNNMPMYSQPGNRSKSNGRLNSLGGSNFHLPNLGKKKKNRNTDDDDDYLGIRGPKGGDDDDDEKDTNIPANSDVRQMNFSDLSHLKDRGRYGGFDAMDTAPIIPVLDVSNSGHGAASNGMSSAQYRKQKTMQKKQMLNNMSNMNSYQHNHNLLNPIGADDYNDGPRSMSLAGNQPRPVAPINNFQQQGPRSMSFTTNPMQQYPNQSYPAMQSQQGLQQAYPNDPRAMSLQNSKFQSRNQSMMNGQNPMLPNGRNQSMMNGQNPMMQNGRNQSMMNGQNPMMQNGRNQSMMNGQNPMMQNGRNQSMMNSQNPMTQNGRNQSMMNGQNPMMQNGRNQSMMNGQNPMMQNGRNQSMMNGQNPMMQNGRNQSMMNGQNPMLQNGRNQSMMNSQNPMLQNGRNQSMMNSQNPMLSNGRNQSLMNDQNPMNNYKNNNGSNGDILAHSHYNNGSGKNFGKDSIPPSPPPPPTKSELDRLKGTPKKGSSNSPARYGSESPARYKSANGNTSAGTAPSKFASNSSPSPMNYNSTTSRTPHKSPMKYDYLDDTQVKNNGISSSINNNGFALPSSKTNTPSKYESLEFGNHPYSVRDSALSNNDLFNDLVRDEEDIECNQSENDDENVVGKIFNSKSDYYSNYDDHKSKPISGKSLDFNKSHDSMPKKSLFSTSDDDSDNNNFGGNIPFISGNTYKEDRTSDTQLNQNSKKNKFRFNDSDSDNEDDAGLQQPIAPNMRRKPPPIDSSDASSSGSLNNTQLKTKNSKNNFMAKLEASIDDTSVLNNDRKNNSLLNVDSAAYNEYSNRISRSNYKTLSSPDDEQISKGFFNRRKSSSFGDDDSATNKRDSKRISSRGSIAGGAGMNGFFKKLGLKKKNSISESSKKKKGSELDSLNAISSASNGKKVDESFDESLEFNNNSDTSINHSGSKYTNQGKTVSSINQRSESSADKYGYKLSNKETNNLDNNVYDDDRFNLTTKYGFDKPSSNSHSTNKENNERNAENSSHVDKYGYKLSSDAVKSRERLLSNDFKDSNSSLNFHATESNMHSLDSQAYDEDFAKRSTSFGDYMNSVLSDIGDRASYDGSKNDDDGDGLGFATAKAEVAKEMKFNLNQNDYAVRTNFVPLSKKLNFTVEQLGILNANKSLMNELQLMTKELTDSVQREIRLDGELRKLKLGKNDVFSNNDEIKFEELQDEMRSKVLDQAKMVDELNRERKLRQLAEERVVALEGGKADIIPTNLEMNYKITDLQTQLLEFQDKINQQEELIAKHDTEKNSLKEDNLQLEIELQKFKNDTVPNLVNEIEILKKSDIKNYQKAQEQLNLYKQEIQNLKMKLIGNSQKDGGRLETNSETENQRDALREALKNLRESKDKEIRHGKERIQQLERRVNKLSELNEKLQQKLLG